MTMDQQEFQESVRRITATKNEVIFEAERHVHDAMKRIVELMQSKDDKVALEASVFIVERLIGKARQSVQNTNQDIVRQPPPPSEKDYLNLACGEGGTAH